MTEPLPHLLYEPTGGAAPYPLIVFLHASGERGDGSNINVLRNYCVPAYVEQGNALPAYVLAPQCPLGIGWNSVIPELDATIDAVIATRPIDQRRITLTGFGMGGNGAWAYVTQNQTRFAAMLPVAGTAFHYADFLPKINPCDIGATPTWIIQSERDPKALAKDSDQVVTVLIDCGAIFTYTRYDTEGHSATARRAYFDPAIYEWLLGQTKT